MKGDRLDCMVCTEKVYVDGETGREVVNPGDLMVAAERCVMKRNPRYGRLAELRNTGTVRWDAERRVWRCEQCGYEVPGDGRGKIELEAQPGRELVAAVVAWVHGGCNEQ